MSALGVISGVIRGRKVVVGGLGGGRARRPSMLRSTRYRSCASMEVILNMQTRDDCLFRLDLRPCIGSCMRIGGFGGVTVIHNMRVSGRMVGGRLNGIRVPY